MDSGVFNLESLGIVENSGAEGEIAAVVDPIVVEPVIDLTNLEAEPAVVPAVTPVVEAAVEPIIPVVKPVVNNFGNVLDPFAQYLSEQGIIELPTAEDGSSAVGSIESLSKLVQDSIEKNKFSSLNESQVRYLKALEAGIPKTDFEKAEIALSAFNNLNEEVLTKDNQKRFDLIYQSLVSGGIDEEASLEVANNIMLDPAKSLKIATSYRDKLYEEAKSNYDSLISTGKEKLVLKETEFKAALQSKGDVLGSIVLNDVLRKNILDNAFNTVAESPTGIPLNAFEKWRSDNPLESGVVLNALMVYTNGFKDLGKLEGKLMSKAAGKVEEALRATTLEKAVSSEEYYLEGGLKLV